MGGTLHDIIVLITWLTQVNRWAILNVAAGFQQATSDDKLVMMAAGYLEGALTNK